jgi:hypothetical protein
VGPLVDPDELGSVPANTSARRWVPQLAVLGHASAFVTHAGMGGCSEGLWHGVPMVAVPQAVDQFDNAVVPALQCSSLAVAARDLAARRSGSRSLRDRYVEASPTALKMIGIV